MNLNMQQMIEQLVKENPEAVKKLFQEHAQLIERFRSICTNAKTTQELRVALLKAHKEASCPLEREYSLQMYQAYQGISDAKIDHDGFNNFYKQYSTVFEAKENDANG